jgi:hypothetical protein
LFVVAFACLLAGSYAQNFTDCELYCGGMNATCPEVYTMVGSTPGIQVCGLLCGLWLPGVVNATNGDTLACRRYHLGLAMTAAMANNTVMRQVHCSHAGPTGGTNMTGYYCGDVYDLYCDLFRPPPTFALAGAYLCKDHGYDTREECITDVRANVPASGQLVTLTVQVTSGDSIECRGSFAAGGANVTGNKTLICPASYWHGSTYAGTEQCSTACKSFCRAFGNVCGFSSTSYADSAACMTACAAFKVNNNMMRIGTAASDLDSVGCRKYHTLVANMSTGTLRTTHCGHAGVMSSTCTNTTGTDGGAGFAIAPATGLIMALLALVIGF